MSTELSTKKRDALLDYIENVEEWLRRGDARYPAMFERAREMFFDESTETFETKTLDAEGMMTELKIETRKKVSEKGKLVILQAFARLTGMKEQALAAKGLGKHGPKKIEQHLHVNVFNLTSEQIAALEPPARELYLQMSVAALMAAQSG